jgi:hypothetical protein
VIVDQMRVVGDVGGKVMGCDELGLVFDEAKFCQAQGGKIEERLRGSHLTYSDTQFKRDPNFYEGSTLFTVISASLPKGTLKH